MVQQQEDIKRTAHPESGESEGAKVKSPGADQRRAAWEKTLESFVERFDFTPVDLKPDVHDGVPLVAGTDMPLSTIERLLCDPIVDVRDSELEWPIWVDSGPSDSKIFTPANVSSWL